MIDTDANFSCYNPSIVEYRYVGVTWGIIVCLVGSVGNVLTVLAYALDKKLQTRFNLLIINLTLADIIYCTFLQPFSVDAYLHLYWRSGATFCQVFGMLLMVSNCVAILNMCVIAVSRYILITNSKLFDRVFSRMGVWLILLGIWVVVISSYVPLWPVLVLVPKVCTCSFHRIKGRPYATILMGFYFIVGLSCVGIFYLLIYLKVKSASKVMDQYKLKTTRTAKGHVAGIKSAIPGTFQEVDSVVDTAAFSEVNSERVSSYKSTISSQSTDLETPGSSLHSRTRDSNIEFKKVTRMCFVVFLFFVLSYIPFLLLNTFDIRNRAPQILHMITANLTWLNSFSNPIIYAAMSQQFRDAYRRVFHLTMRKVRMGV